MAQRIAGAQNESLRKKGLDGSRPFFVQNHGDTKPFGPLTRTIGAPPSSSAGIPNTGPLTLTPNCSIVRVEDIHSSRPRLISCFNGNS
jgi:hypothetical protein